MVTEHTQVCACCYCTCGASSEAVCPSSQGCPVWTPPWPVCVLFLLLDMQFLYEDWGQPGSLQLPPALQKYITQKKEQEAKSKEIIASCQHRHRTAPHKGEKQGTIHQQRGWNMSNKDWGEKGSYDAISRHCESAQSNLGATGLKEIIRAGGTQEQFLEHSGRGICPSNKGAKIGGLIKNKAPKNELN